MALPAGPSNRAIIVHGAGRCDQAVRLDAPIVTRMTVGESCSSTALVAICYAPGVGGTAGGAGGIGTGTGF